MAGAAAGDGAAAVAGGAGLAWRVVGGRGALAVEAAVGAAPDSALPVRADCLEIAAVGCEAEAGGCWAGACLGLDGWVDVLVAVVGDAQRHVGIAFVDPVHRRPAHVMRRVAVGDHEGQSE